MLKYRLSKFSEKVTVSVDSDDPDKSGQIIYEGDKDLVEAVKDWLENESGLYGHLIGSSTTPIDLDAVMRSPGAEKFNPELIEGLDIVKNYEAPEEEDDVFY